MNAPTAGRGAEALDHPLYRIAHLHGSEWVTLRPEEQHSPSQDEPARPWADATIYRCEKCEERVIVAPA